jgi:hypothetical protein
VRPPVWRRLLMPGTMTLSQLHTAIQAVMGWGGTLRWNPRMKLPRAELSAGEQLAVARRAASSSAGGTALADGGIDVLPRSTRALLDAASAYSISILDHCEAGCRQSVISILRDAWTMKNGSSAVSKAIGLVSPSPKSSRSRQTN